MGAVRKPSTPAGEEEQLTARVHHRVGGPARLSKFADAALVREAVLRSLADEQPTTGDRDRVARGELTPLERRVVRTVTNRGAAVRSRERTRREVESLRAALADRDRRIAYLTQEVATARAALNAMVPHDPAGAKIDAFPPRYPNSSEQLPVASDGFPGQSFMASLDHAAFSAIGDSAKGGPSKGPLEQ